MIDDSKGLGRRFDGIGGISGGGVGGLPCSQELVKNTVKKPLWLEDLEFWLFGLLTIFLT